MKTTKTFLNRFSMSILIIATIIIIVIGLYLVLAEYFTRFDVDKIDKSMYSDEEYSLVFYQIGEPDLADDGNRIRFVLKKGKKTIGKYNSYVYYPARSLTSENWDVKWYDDRVEIFVLPEAASSEPNPIILYFDE